MAEFQPSTSSFDVQVVLDKTWEDILDYMQPLSILDLLETKDIFKRREIRDIKEKPTTTTDKNTALLECIRNKGPEAYECCLRDSGQETLADLLIGAENNEDLEPKRTKMKTEAGQSQETIKLLRDLREDLIRHYRKNESTMPVAPLVEEHETELLNFYVRPPMMAYNKPNAFGQKKIVEKDKNEKRKQDKEDTKTEVNSYRELLFKDREPFKRIYVSADAGMGKTSFSKMLAQTWCQAYEPDKSLEEKFAESDVKTMEEFDFLFLIYLREYQGTDECSIEGMVLHMLKHKLAKACSYSEVFLEQVLNNKRCLIVVDGFDEWVHPKSCTIEEASPHIRNYKGCSVLTTTRPWKLSTARLKTSCIDRHVEISRLDKKTSEKLESLAIQFLEKNQEQNSQRTEKATPRTRDNFDKRISQTVLGDMRYIPYILLQLICLWFQGSSLGRSKCEIYSNIIELTLQRGLEKIDRQCKHNEKCSCKLETSPDETIVLPRCMTSNTTSTNYMCLLKKLGKLATFVLFRKIKETTLIIDKNDVLNYLSEVEIDFCLRVGLLSQVKDTCSGAERRFNVLFQHKSVQEFLAALYISRRWEDDIREKGEIKEIIFSVCKSVSDILEMSNVFKFVCGMNPDVYSRISQGFRAVVDSDQRAIDYRNSVLIDDFDPGCKPLKSYQSMQVDCLQESVRNGYDPCDIVLDDVIIHKEGLKEDTVTVFTSLVIHNLHNMKSLRVINEWYVSGDDKQNVDPSQCRSLENFSVSWNASGPLYVADILSVSARTLKYLALTSVKDEYVDAITNLSNLKGISFTDVSVSHDNHKRLNDYINNCTLKQLCVTNIKCLSHKNEKCYLYSFDLSKSTQLQYLLLNTIPVTDIISQQCLKTLWLLLIMPHCNIQKLFDSFENMIKLTDLHCIIKCSDHDADCPGFKLNLDKQNQLKALSMNSVYTLPFKQLYVNTEHLLECNISLCGSDNISSVLAQLQDAPVLSSLTFRYIRDTPARMQIPKLQQLTKFCLLSSDLGDSMLTLHPELTSLENIHLSKVKMSMSSWSELFLSISNLPQPITVHFYSIRLTTAEWRKLLFNIIGELPKVIRVQLEGCRGLSCEEILQDMQSYPAFSILDDEENFLSHHGLSNF